MANGGGRLVPRIKRRLGRLGSTSKGTTGETYRQMVLAERKRIRDLREQVRGLKDELKATTPKAAAFDSFAPVFQNGASLESALVGYMRTAHTSGARTETRAFAHALMDDPQHSTLGHLCFGVFLIGEQLYGAADSCFEVAGRELSLREAPGEYYTARFDVDPVAAEADLVAFLEERRTTLPHATYVELLKVLAKYLRFDLLISELAHLKALEAADPQLDETGTQLVEWWTRHTAEYRVPAEPLPEGTISLAVMDYHLLDRSRTSSNRGDYVQTLAALANVTRFQDVEFTGGELGELLTELQGQIKPERRLSGPSARVVPIALDRDFASSREYPENTWLLCNGWFMHRNYRGDIDFPFPSTVNPLFISFHVQDPDVLTPEVVENLKQYEPIGCRDWTTVYRLADFGVKAFFSGCVTSTVGQVMPPITTTIPKTVAVVESPTVPEDLVGKKSETFIQVGDYVRDFSLVEGIRDARAMLSEYLTYEKVITSRLHCYVPSRSIGLDADFRPRNRSDVRFEGLLDLTDAEFLTMRTGLEDKLAAVFGAVFSGASRDDVMALWREITADDVAAADVYRSTFPPAPATSIDVTSVLPEIHRQVVVKGDPAREHEVKVAFGIDQNLKDQLAIVLQSLADNTSAGVDVHVMCRGLDEEYYERLHRQLPEFTFYFYNFDLVDYGEKLRMLSHTTVSTMDRLFLPELLPGIDKVLYLDADILVCDDVADVYTRDLGDAVVMGKFSNLKTWRNVVRLVTRASLSLPPAEAWVLRRRLHHDNHLAAPTFNAGILLLNLRLMREEQFTKNYLHLVEHCAFNDQDVLNIYAGERSIELEPEWNHVPNQDRVEEPKIIHWAGPNKPWKEFYVWGRPRYDAIAARLQESSS